MSTVLPSYLITLLDKYCANPSLIWVVLLEAIMLAIFYGLPTFIDDLVEITRSAALDRAWPLFYVFYYFLTPGALAAVKS